MGITWEYTNLEKDTRAIELAKIAMGWAEMTQTQQMDNARALVIRAQEIKAAL